MWKPPGKWKLANPALRALPELLRAFGRRLPASLEIETQGRVAATRRSRTGTWPCSAPIRWPRATASAPRSSARSSTAATRGEAAYLESSKPDNVPYYERFGFKVTGEVTLGSATTAPTLWFMSRRPTPRGLTTRLLDLRDPCR